MWIEVGRHVSGTVHGRATPPTLWSSPIPTSRFRSYANKAGQASSFFADRTLSFVFLNDHIRSMAGIACVGARTLGFPGRRAKARPGELGHGHVFQSEVSAPSGFGGGFSMASVPEIAFLG